MEGAQRKGRWYAGAYEINQRRYAAGTWSYGAGSDCVAVALARERTEGEVASVKVALNSGMYKNAFTCGIPNSSEYGNLYAAALGAVAADANRGLESLGVSQRKIIRKRNRW